MNQAATRYAGANADAPFPQGIEQALVANPWFDDNHEKPPAIFLRGTSNDSRPKRYGEPENDVDGSKQTNAIELCARPKCASAQLSQRMHTPAFQTTLVIDATNG
ncbi:hypothetical protein [Dyella sp.]|uniref:hypothetical protein n=1 Tax=Dyella sp. TaxID=1869338 RepID=UPI003F82382C